MNQPASAYFMEDRHDPIDTHTLSVAGAKRARRARARDRIVLRPRLQHRSLTVSETESQKHVSRITIVTTGTPMGSSRSSTSSIAWFGCTASST